MVMTAFEADAKRMGRLEGRQEGIAQGFFEGARQKALETAKILKQFGDPVQKIMQATGLSKEDVENISY